MNEMRRPHSLFFPLLLVTAGVFFLLANLGIIQNTIWGIMAIYWPLIFVIGGLDGLYQHENWVGPLVGIGLGTVLLLGNLHYLQWGSLELLLRLWPLLLVAWGLDIAFGREKSTWSTLVRVGLGVLLVAAIVWVTVASPFVSSMKTESFTQLLDGAQQSNLEFSVAAGRLTLSGGAPDDTLVSGKISLPKGTNLEPEYSEPVDGESSLSLEGAGVVVFPLASTAPWNFQVNPVIPLNITSRMAFGNMVEDLSDVKVKELTSKMAFGRTVLTLPETGSTEGSAQVAVGELVIRVPKGQHVIIHASTGAVTRDLPAGYTASEGTIESSSQGDNVVELNVGIGVGNLVIQEIE